VNVPEGTFVSSQLIDDPGSGVLPVPQAALVVVPSDRATVNPEGAELSGVVGITHVTCTVRTFVFGTVAVTLVGAFMAPVAAAPAPKPDPVQNAHAVATTATEPQMTPAATSRFLGFIPFP
jgi:hypothetical protein